MAKRICFMLLLFTLSITGCFAQSADDCKYAIDIHDPEFNWIIKTKLYFNKNDYDVLTQYPMIVGHGIKNVDFIDLKFRNMYFFKIWGRGRKPEFIVASDNAGNTKILNKKNLTEFLRQYNEIVRQHPLLDDLYENKKKVNLYRSFLWHLNDFMVYDSFDKSSMYYDAKNQQIVIPIVDEYQNLFKNVSIEEFRELRSKLQKEKIVFYPRKNLKHQQKQPCGYLECYYTDFDSKFRNLIKMKIRIYYTGEVEVMERRIVFTFNKNMKFLTNRF